MDNILVASSRRRELKHLTLFYSYRDQSVASSRRRELKRTKSKLVLNSFEVASSRRRELKPVGFFRDLL